MFLQRIFAVRHAGQGIVFISLAEGGQVDSVAEPLADGYLATYLDIAMV